MLVVPDQAEPMVLGLAAALLVRTAPAVLVPLTVEAVKVPKGQDQTVVMTGILEAGVHPARPQPQMTPPPLQVLATAAGIKQA